MSGWMREAETSEDGAVVVTERNDVQPNRAPPNCISFVASAPEQDHARDLRQAPYEELKIC